MVSFCHKFYLFMVNRFLSRVDGFMVPFIAFSYIVVAIAGHFVLEK